jgi:very-long-chain (3R)-3-hydroxyacyl-CoA dehydratase
VSHREWIECCSWGIVEVPRYTFYAMNLIGQVPSFLLFLRYHLFMVLYPSGVAGEVLCMLSALPFLAKGVSFCPSLTRLYSLT